MNPLARPAYEQRVRQAIDRYDAEEREIEAKIQSIEHEPIPVIALHEVNEQTFGVGADGELVELDRMLAEDSNESNETFKEDI